MVAKMLVSSVIVCSLSLPMPAFSASLPRQTQTTPESRDDDLKSRISRIGLGEIITVFLINGKIFIGRITRIGDTEFEISKVDRETTYTIHYDEVKKVEREIYLGFRKVQTTAGGTTAPTSDSRTEGMKLLINNLGIGAMIAVSHLNGRKFRGMITRIGDRDFEISEFNREMTFTIQYEDVKKIDESRFSDRPWLIAMLAAVVALPIIFLVARPKPPDFPRF